MTEAKPTIEWHKVAGLGDLPEGRVKTVTAAQKSFALVHYEGEYAALDNRCPHQGGPLGEGSIEKGLLRCPWHGWDYCPKTGKAPGFDDGVECFATEVRDDGVYVGVEVEPAPPRTVSNVMAETMTAWGIDTVFGMVGHSNLGLADALRVEEEAGRLRYIGIRHEGAAAFAASAFAKLTGRPAACLAIAGPGSTNLLTGLWDAKVDRAPVLALCGQVDTQVLGPGAFQEVDLAAAFSAVSTWNQTVLHGSRHAELMSLAVKHALVNRDVVNLIFPDEVQNEEADEDAVAGGPDGRIGSVEVAPPVDAVEAAVERMRGAKRPVIVVGHGARFDMDAVLELAEALDAPVLTTFKAKGLISDRHPLGCGVLGRSGTPIASYFMNEADLLLVFGASFSNHTGITPKVPTIQVDLDRLTLGKFHPVDVPVWGSIARSIELFQGGLAGREASIDPRAEIAERWAIWREEKRRRRNDDQGRGLNSAVVFEALTRAVPEDAVLCVDVGNNTYSFGRYFECARQSVLMSGYLGSIGFSLPAALGAWSAVGDPRRALDGTALRKVVSVSGDGGFGQYMAEVTTAVKYGMDLCHVLLNNGELGKISKEQRAAEWDVWQTSLRNPNFAEYAESCGALGIRVTEASQLAAALDRALAHPGPALVEVMTDVELI